VHKIVDFAELFSGMSRSRIVEPVLTGFRLKDGAKVAEALVFSREIGYHRAANIGEWSRIRGLREMPVEVRFCISLLFFSGVGCE
jgi:hypothetical protein